MCVCHTASYSIEDVRGGGMADKATSIAGGSGTYATKSWKESAIKADIIGYVNNMELKDIDLVIIIM